LERYYPDYLLGNPLATTWASSALIRRTLMNNCLFEFSWLAIKDAVEDTIRKRNAGAVKTKKFLCIMAASRIGLFRLFSLRFVRIINNSIKYCNVILVQVTTS